LRPFAFLVHQAEGSAGATVAKGELKQAEKIGAAAAKLLQRHHGHRCFAWELRQGRAVNSPREQACSGDGLQASNAIPVVPVGQTSRFAGRFSNRPESRLASLHARPKTGSLQPAIRRT